MPKAWRLAFLVIVASTAVKAKVRPVETTTDDRDIHPFSAIALVLSKSHNLESRVFVILRDNSVASFGLQ